MAKNTIEHGLLNDAFVVKMETNTFTSCLGGYIFSEDLCSTMTAFFWQEIVITNIARRNLVLNKQAMCLLVKINIYSNALPFSENFRLAKIFGENSQSETNLFPFTQNPSRA